jgi:hypothetical protein
MTSDFWAATDLFLKMPVANMTSDFWAATDLFLKMPVA